MFGYVVSYFYYNSTICTIGVWVTLRFVFLKMARCNIRWYSVAMVVNIDPRF